MAVGLMRLVSHIPRYCILFVCVGSAIAACYGQTSSSGALKVVVKEARDLPIAGASCSLSTVATSNTPVAAATSDDQGIVRFTKVLPGRYTLTVTKEGFETLVNSDIVIDEKLENEIAVVLTVAAVQERVIVTAPDEAATSVEAGSSTPAGNIKRETLRSLPLAVAR